jgi:hypothetical protein
MPFDLSLSLPWFRRRSRTSSSAAPPSATATDERPDDKREAALSRMDIAKGISDADQVHRDWKSEH